jgi:hypothetical protein
MTIQQQPCGGRSKTSYSTLTYWTKVDDPATHKHHQAVKQVEAVTRGRVLHHMQDHRGTGKSCCGTCQSFSTGLENSAGLERIRPWGRLNPPTIAHTYNRGTDGGAVLHQVLDHRHDLIAGVGVQARGGLRGAGQRHPSHCATINLLDSHRDQMASCHVGLVIHDWA